MDDHEYSFLDLTVMSFLRRRVISPDAAVLFDREFRRVLWANAIGTKLFGGNAVGDLIGFDLPADNQIMRQLRNASAQLGGNMRIVRKFRISRGLRSEIVQGTLSVAQLPDGREAVLLICDDLPGRDRHREHELAQLSVDSLEGFADAAAIVDEFGLPLASTDDFDSMGIDADELQGLVTVAARDDDRLVKRPLKSESGTIVAAGIGRIRDMPGRYLIVLADAGAAEEAPEAAWDNEDDLEDEAASAPVAFSAAAEDQHSTAGTVSHLIEDEEADTTASTGDDLSDTAVETVDEEPADVPGDTISSSTLNPVEEDSADAEADDTSEARDEELALSADDELDTEPEESSSDEVNLLEPAAEAAPDDEPLPAPQTEISSSAENFGSSLVDRWYFWADDKPASEASDDASDLDFEPGEEQQDTASSPADGEMDTDTVEDFEPDSDDTADEPAKLTGAHDEDGREAEDFSGPDETAGDTSSEDTDESPVEQKSVPAAGSGAVRFAFSIDRDGVFQSVSSELAETVGTGTANIAGKSWKNVARALGFDESGAISQLLKKADTWSGRSVLWPVQGSDMAMPVDLAALPIFDRERNFEGFKGFGVIRTADAMVDPLGRGLDASRRLENATGYDGETEEPAGMETFEPVGRMPGGPLFEDVPLKTGWRGDVGDDELADENLASRTLDGESPDGETFASGIDDGENDETASQQSTPLIDPDRVKITSNNGNVSANVVRLETRRNAEKSAETEGEKLSSKEAAAFNEIARKLDKARQERTAGEDSPEAAKEANATDDANRNMQESAAAGVATGNDQVSREEASEPLDQPEEQEDARSDADQDKQPVFGKRTAPIHDQKAEPGTSSDEHGRRLTDEENRQLLEELPVPVLVYRAGQALFANQALLEETGYDSLDEVAGAGGVDALLSSQPDDDAGIAPVIQLLRKDGTSRPITPNLKSIPWQAGKALCLTFQPGRFDASQEAQGLKTGSAGEPASSLDMVRVSELQSILETAADGILITDENGIIESVNSSAEALFSIRNADMAGKELSSLFAQESRQAIEEYVETTGAGGMARLMNDGREVIGIEASGGLIPLFLTLGKVGGNGRLCAVLRDLTEWKRTSGELVEARRRAEDASEQKSEFLSRVSHEIREPLTTIIGFSDIMIEERFGPIGNPRYKEYLADINRSGVHVLDLVNDLLDISRIEAGKMELTYEAVDLNRVAAETVALLQPQANAKRVIIRTSLSRAVPKIVADLRSMRQIIVNLLSNAIKYSPANSQIIVSTTFETNGEVALRVRDTGPGMSKEELARALEPFGRLDKLQEDGTKSKGTGLGLPLTKALVEANRAYFELESEEGEGTIAHVQFPAQRVLAD
jgi:PAS domain S-box-containing protein